MLNDAQEDWDPNEIEEAETAILTLLKAANQVGDAGGVQVVGKRGSCSIAPKG